MCGDLEWVWLIVLCDEFERWIVLVEFYMVFVVFISWLVFIWFIKVICWVMVSDYVG